MTEEGSSKPNASDDGDAGKEAQDEQQGTEGKPKNFEDVLRAIGNPGRYQVIQLLFLLATVIPMTFVNTKYVFISLEPNHRCSPINDTDVYKGVTIPSNETYLYRTYNDSCEVQVQKNVSGAWKSVKSIGCINGYDYDGGKDVSFITEWDLVCDKTGVPQLAQVVIAAGGFIGAILVNSLSDKFGRWAIISLSLILTVVTEVATTYAPDIYSMIAIRFLSGFVSSGLYVTTYVLAYEMVKSSHRVDAAVISGMFWGVCIAALAGVAFALRDIGWRGFQLYSSLICLFPLLFTYFTNESVPWLHSMGNKKRAEKIIRQACKTNGVSFDDKIKGMLEELLKKDESYQNPGINDEKVKTNSIFDIFKHKRILVIVSITCFACFTNELTYNGLFLTSSTLVGDLYLNMAILALVGIPGGIVNVIFLHLKGRKVVIIIFTLLTALTLLISTFIGYADIEKDMTDRISLVFFVLGKFANSVGYNALYLYIPETFPTTVRSFCMGIATSGATVGGIVAPYLLPMQKRASWAPGVMLVACSILTSILFLKLPETKGRQLAATLEDVKSDKTDRKESKAMSVFSVTAKD